MDLPEFTVLRAAGERAPSVFERRSGKSLSSAGIPGYFSERGYNEHFVKALAAWGSGLALEEAWILGRGPAGGGAVKLATGANDLKRSDRRVRELYLQDFTNEWQTFLLDIRLRPPRNLDETIERANVLAMADSPLTLLVREVATQTTLISSEAGGGSRVNQATDSVKRGIDEINAAIAAAANAPIATDRIEMIVQERFREFKQLAQPTGKAKIDDLAKEIQAYAVSLRSDQLAMSGGSTKRSREADTKLASTANQLPTPAREIIEALTGSAAKLASTGVQANAAAQTKGAVGQGCSAVARSYPFDRRSTQDAFPADFAQVFGPDGTIKRAFDLIAPAVDMSRDPWQPRPGPDGAAAGNPSDLRAFKQAQDIRELFFAGKSTPGFELDIRVIAPAGEKAELDVDGTVVSSTDDNKRVSWPGPKNSERVALSVGGRSPVIVTTGFWALHRLVDKGTVAPSSSPTVVTVGLNAEGKEIRVELRARSFRHPLTLPALRSFSCPGR